MDVTLTVTCRVQDQKLLVEYSISHHGSQPLLAYDGAPGIPPGAQWPDLDGQIYISAGDGLVELKRINPPSPAGKLSARAFVPPVSQVFPGEPRSVRFQLPLPLVERSQYTPDFPGAQYQERMVHWIRVTLGYFWKGKSTELQAFPENPTAYRVLGAHGKQQFVSSGCTQDALVRVRVDDQFQRF